MARRPSSAQRRRYAALIQKLEPQLRAAFEESIRDLRAGVRWADLIKALEARNIEAAIRALNIDQAAFYRLTAAKTAAYAEGGAITTATIPLGAGASIGARFDMTNPGAQRWIRENVANRVVSLAEEQVGMLREVIETGYAAGRHPTAIGRDLAGRVINGKRTGGVIGLDGPRAERLANVTRAMETPDGVRSLVTKDRKGNLKLKYKVNAATEKRILRAYNAGTEVSAADRAISVRQYENSLLKARGDTIARTETAQAVRGAQLESWQQMVDRGEISDQEILKSWIHGGGPKDPRPHHVAMNGVTVRGLNTPFVLSTGVSMQCPHDPNAPASEVVACNCSMEIRRDPSFGII